MNSPLFLCLAAKEYFENGTRYASKYFKLDNEGKIKPFDSTSHTKLCVPATNISFSLELVFKAFLMHSGNEKFKSHNLLDLYNSLNFDFKQLIIEHYKSHNTYKDYIAVRLMESLDGREHGRIEIFNNSMNAEEYIPLMLETHKFAFLNFRYLHEFKANQTHFFYFKEFSNFALSALIVLGKTLNLKIVTNPISRTS